MPKARNGRPTTSAATGRITVAVTNAPGRQAAVTGTGTTTCDAAMSTTVDWSTSSVSTVSNSRPANGALTSTRAVSPTRTGTAAGRLRASAAGASGSPEPRHADVEPIGVGAVGGVVPTAPPLAA